MFFVAPQDEVTQLLAEWGKGSQAALHRLMPLVYVELHRMASRYMSRQNAGHTLQPMALINEAYVRLASGDGREWVNRAHFFSVAAKSMRHVLVDHARARRATKRGSGTPLLSLDEAIVISDERTVEIIALDDALSALAELNQRQSDVVELRYFGGLTVEETAQVKKMSPETVLRDWRAAKAWLYSQLSQRSATGNAPNDARSASSRS
jgi:RNA polymerase sigma-70 factor, ECF subfamily